MPSSGSDSKSDGGDASKLEYDRSTSSNTASLEPLGRVEALQRINTDLSKKLTETEKKLQNRSTEHESELEETQRKLEELKSELSATKREEKELRVKDASVIFHIVLMNADCPELD
jgi:chromosome segregation ATPase